ncbi:MAG: hypothetical protein HZB50_17345 [Chloroflexi bacterium]|nr:hypothetical protein [Chloroflexota bacterium]
MKLRIIFLASFLGLLSACTQLVESTPTPLPTHSLPTMVALTGQAIFATSNALTQTVPPTETLVPTKTPVPLTAFPTSIPTIEPGFTEFAQIHFLSLGPMSSLVSPIRLQVMMVAGESGIVQYDLLGEDGRLLQRIVKKVERFPKGIYQSVELSFEIRAVSEAGYIRINTKDKAGRIQALNTMPVLLYSVGSNEINPLGNMIYERVMLEGLKDGGNVFGGVLNLKGRFWPFNDQIVVAELLLPSGEVISSRILKFDGIDTQQFETTLPYKVTEPTLVRLTFRQDNPLLSVSDPVLNRSMYIYTMEVLLNP